MWGKGLTPRFNIRLRPSKALVLEVLAFVCVVVGVGMIYPPAAVIILGIGLYLASIGVPPNVDSSERDS